MTREAVLFDLFDTLVLFDRSRLPEVHANGKTMRSTAGHLHEAFRPFAPGLELDDFSRSRIEATVKELQEERDAVKQLDLI